MTGLFELLTNKYWMVSPDYVQAIRGMLQHNLANHTQLDKTEKTVCKLAYMAADGSGFELSASSDDPDDENYNGASEERKESFVTVLYVDGPVTRNGDACSYGSRELRDMLCQAADSEQCLGHLFYINTPGGSAWAINDFKQAIDYAHNKGQKVYAYIDGMCASAGMYLAALCDERYYMNPKDQIGCIGVMAAFYTEKDGSKCEYTNETYHEIYDPESFDKNREIRDIANDGNTEKLVADLAKLGVEFRADVKKHCPNAKEEHLHGKVFDAKEVEGILVDGQRSFGEVIRYISATANASREPQNSLTPKNNINMKEKFPKVFALLGVEEMECSEEGSFFNTGLLQTLEAKISEMQSANAEAKALVEQLTAEKTAMAEEHTKAIETLKAEHAAALEEKQNAIAALEQEKADNDEKIVNLQNDNEGQKTQIENLNKELDGAKASLETAQKSLEEKDQQISDLNAKVEDLTQEPGNEPAGAASPKNNGEGLQEQEVVVNQYVFDPALPYEENLRREAEFNAQHGK